MKMFQDRWEKIFVNKDSLSGTKTIKSNNTRICKIRKELYQTTLNSSFNARPIVNENFIFTTLKLPPMTIKYITDETTLKDAVAESKLLLL